MQMQSMFLMQRGPEDLKKGPKFKVKTPLTACDDQSGEQLTGHSRCQETHMNTRPCDGQRVFQNLKDNSQKVPYIPTVQEARQGPDHKGSPPMSLSCHPVQT